MSDKVKFVQVSTSVSTNSNGGQMTSHWAIDNKGRTWTYDYQDGWEMVESPDEPKEKQNEN